MLTWNEHLEELENAGIGWTELAFTEHRDIRREWNRVFGQVRPRNLFGRSREAPVKLKGLFSQLPITPPIRTQCITGTKGEFAFDTQRVDEFYLLFDVDTTRSHRHVGLAPAFRCVSRIAHPCAWWKDQFLSCVLHIWRVYLIDVRMRWTLIIDYEELSDSSPYTVIFATVG